MRLMFMRHGKADKAGPDQADVDRVLGDTGKQQAAALREKLNGTKFNLVISSPAPRAVDTAAIATNALRHKIVIINELYPDPKDGQLGTAIDELCNRPHLGYCEVAKYLAEHDGGALTEWAHDLWPLIDADLMAIPDDANVAVFGHAVCLQSIGMAACESNAVLVEQLSQLNLGECEGFAIEFANHRPVKLELV